MGGVFLYCAYDSSFKNQMPDLEFCLRWGRWGGDEAWRIFLS